MNVRFNDLKYKEVINISDGTRLGYVDDAECELGSGKISSLIIPGKPRIFGIFGKCDEYIVPWEKIVKIGDDIILTDYVIPVNPSYTEKENFWKRLFK